MKAVILTAGVGSRIRPLTNNKPKSLLEVNGKAIIHNAIENLLNFSIKDIIVVTGYLEGHIKSFIAQTFPSLSVTFIKNELYDKTNTAYSLLLTKDVVGDDDFIKFDADVIFEKEVLEKILDPKHVNCLAIDTNIHLDKEEVKVILDNMGKIKAVGKSLDATKAHGESIGIEKISKKAAKEFFKELEILLQDSANHQRYYDDTYTTLVEKGIPFSGVNITGLKWVEIDTHEDYHRANKMFAKK